MPTAYITVGVSASGKTHWAEQQKDCVNINRDDIRFNIVCPDSDYRTYKFKKENERRVTEIQEEMAEEAVKNQQDVIISDTNLNPKIRNKWLSFFEDRGYEAGIVRFPVEIEKAWKRDAYRLNGVGHSVIYRQHQKYNEYVGRRVYEPNENLPDAVIFDIDGTLADHQGIRSPFDWDKVHLDKRREMVVMMLEKFWLEQKIILLSGRDEKCRDLTISWLKDNGIPFDELHMRPEGDTRKDTIVKEELFFDSGIPERYNVRAVVDDRPSVVRLWHDLKVPNVICVGNPWVEF